METENILKVFFGNLTKNSKRRYKAVLKQFRPFCSHDQLSRATARDVLRYLGGMKGLGKSDLTINNSFNVLSSIFGLLLDFGVMRINPCREASRLVNRRQKRQVRPTQMVNYGHIVPTIQSISERDPLGVRDRGLLAILFGCGLRRSEAHALNVGSIEVSCEGVLFLKVAHAKAGEGRNQPIPNWAWEYLSVLVLQRKSEGADNEDPLFTFYDSSYRPVRRLSDISIYRIFKRYVGVPPHAARATFASRLKSLGYEDRDVAEALGHKGIGQVQIYDKRVRGVSTNCGRKVEY